MSFSLQLRRVCHHFQLAQKREKCFSTIPKPFSKESFLFGKEKGTFGWDTSSEIFQLDKSQGLIE